MLLTIPSVVRETTATVTLNKQDLFSLAPVSSDPYFSVESNVKSCVVEFNSEPGNQKKILRFDLLQSTPSASFLFSAKAKSSFLLERIVLEDNDGGTFVLKREDLPSGLDISVTPTQDPNTVLLLHFNQTEVDSSLSLLSSTLHYHSPYGHTGLEFSSQGKHGSALFPADLTTKHSAVGYLAPTEANFGTGDYTVEMWIKSLTSGQTAGVYDGIMFSVWGVGMGVPGGLLNGNFYSWSLELQKDTLDQKLIVSMRRGSDGDYLHTPNNSLSSSDWTHIAVSRSNGLTKVFVNGVSVAQRNNGAFNQAVGFDNAKIGVGARIKDGTPVAPNSQPVDFWFRGLIDEVRVTKGVARYTSDFTPPTAPLN